MLRKRKSAVKANSEKNESRNETERDLNTKGAVEKNQHRRKPSKRLIFARVKGKTSLLTKLSSQIKAP